MVVGGPSDFYIVSRICGMQFWPNQMKCNNLFISIKSNFDPVKQSVFGFHVEKVVTKCFIGQSAGLVVHELTSD